MGFSEELKKDVRRKAAYRCCICERLDLSLEVHHIIPQEDGGPDIFQNAAPLCPSCHGNYGANKEKRTRITEKRDFWYDQVQKNYRPMDIKVVEDLGTKILAPEHDVSKIKQDLLKHVEERISQITTNNLQLSVSSILSSTVATPESAEATTAVAMWKQVTKLENENASLKSELQFNKSLQYKNGAYWESDEHEPYCSRCWEVDKKGVHMHAMGNPAFYQCPNCKSGSVKAKPELDRPQAHIYRPRHNPGR